MTTTKARHGFTLIELLIVVAIIGLLATITAVALGGSRAKSRDNKRVADMSQIQRALELSYDPGSGYPVAATPTVIGTPSTDALCAKGSVVSFVADTGAGNCDEGKVFMGLVPSDPSPSGSYTYVSTNGAGALCTTAPCTGYCIETTLEADLPQSNLSAGPMIADQTSLKNGSCPVS